MFKYNTNTLKKIEALFKDLGYKVRFEKGNFKPGYCILENKKVVVINKYFSLEARINSMIDIIMELAPEEADITQANLDFYKEMKATHFKP